MRVLCSLAFALVLAACAGDAEKMAAAAPSESGEMEDLEPAGPFDATLEDEPEE